MSDTQSYKIIKLDDRMAYVELQTAILDHVIKLGREIRAKAANGESVERDSDNLEAASRALSAVLAAK